MSEEEVKDPSEEESPDKEAKSTLPLDHDFEDERAAWAVVFKHVPFR